MRPRGNIHIRVKNGKPTIDGENMDSAQVEKALKLFNQLRAKDSKIVGIVYGNQQNTEDY